MFASLTTSRLIKQKEKPTKKVVVLVSRRNGVEQIKYCQMGKRPTDNQLMGRYAVEEWLDKNLEYVQHIEKHLAVKKKKQVQSTSKCVKTAADTKSEWKGNDVDAEEYQECQPVSEFQNTPEDLECVDVGSAGTAQESLEMCSNSEEPIGTCSHSLEVAHTEDSNELSDNFHQELNNCKQMTTKLQEESNELKNIMESKKALNPQLSTELLEEYNKVGKLIAILGNDWKRLRNSLIPETEMEKASDSEMPELTQELQSLNLKSEINVVESDEFENICQLQNVNNETEVVKCQKEIVQHEKYCKDLTTHHNNQEDDYDNYVEDTAKLLAKICELEKELENERAKNENNRAIIDFLKKKFAIKTEELENIAQNVNFENMSSREFTVQ